MKIIWKNSPQSEPEPFEHAMRARLGDAEVMPPDEVWAAIENRMAVQPKSRIAFWWFSMDMFVLGAILCGFAYVKTASPVEYATHMRSLSSNQAVIAQPLVAATQQPNSSNKHHSSAQVMTRSALHSPNPTLGGNRAAKTRAIATTARQSTSASIFGGTGNGSNTAAVTEASTPLSESIAAIYQPVVTTPDVPVEGSLKLLEGQENQSSSQHIIPAKLSLLSRIATASLRGAAQVSPAMQWNGKLKKSSYHQWIVGFTYQSYALLDATAPRKKDVVHGFVSKTLKPSEEIIKEYTYPTGGNVYRAYAQFRPTQNLFVEAGLGYVQSATKLQELTSPVQFQEVADFSFGAPMLITPPQDTLRYSLNYQGVQADIWANAYQSFGRHSASIGVGYIGQRYSKKTQESYFAPTMLMMGSRMRYAYAVTPRTHVVLSGQLSRALSNPLTLDNIQPFNPMFISGNIGMEWVIGK